MKVNEIISELMTCDPDSEVRICFSDIYYPITNILELKHYVFFNIVKNTNKENKELPDKYR